ncbi:hypothetical protein VTJ04DRAFT_6796 [Mycothermus thermophilus]|uniref:uncharacterized protein n=1 Tax=Humicola insolens TaxID=85995 RepID=UPI003744402D
MRTAPRRVAVVSLCLACFVIMALEQGETSLTSKSVKEHDTGARRRASHYTLWPSGSASSPVSSLCNLGFEMLSSDDAARTQDSAATQVSPLPP